MSARDKFSRAIKNAENMALSAALNLAQTIHLSHPKASGSGQKQPNIPLF